MQGADFRSLYGGAGLSQIAIQTALAGGNPLPIETTGAAAEVLRLSSLFLVWRDQHWHNQREVGKLPMRFAALELVSADNGTRAPDPREVGRHRECRTRTTPCVMARCGLRPRGRRRRRVQSRRPEHLMLATMHPANTASAIHRTIIRRDLPSSVGVGTRQRGATTVASFRSASAATAFSISAHARCKAASSITSETDCPAARPVQVDKGSITARRQMHFRKNSMFERNMMVSKKRDGPRLADVLGGHRPFTLPPTPLRLQPASTPH